MTGDMKLFVKNEKVSSKHHDDIIISTSGILMLHKRFGCLPRTNPPNGPTIDEIIHQGITGWKKTAKS